jgi:hypothetical protein
MSDEDSIRDELAQLPVPPESPTFFDDLWRRANERERPVARRWRRTALALAVVAIGAVASAAVLATSTGAATNVADVRGSCASQYQGGPPPGFKPVAGLWTDTSGSTAAATSSGSRSEFASRWIRTACRHARSSRSCAPGQVRR